MIYSWCAAIAQLVERIHGKDEVTGSSPVGGSIFLLFFATMIVVGIGFEVMVMVMRDVRKNKLKANFDDDD